MTTKEYGDFVLWFEFKLDKAANNGVAVRAPLDGDPVFVGMEIQVIDTPNWKTLIENSITSWSQRDLANGLSMVG